MCVSRIGSDQQRLGVQALHWKHSTIWIVSRVCHDFIAWHGCNILRDSNQARKNHPPAGPAYSSTSTAADHEGQRLCMTRACGRRQNEDRLCTSFMIQLPYAEVTRPTPYSSLSNVLLDGLNTTATRVRLPRSTTACFCVCLLLSPPAPALRLQSRLQESLRFLRS